MQVPLGPAPLTDLLGQDEALHLAFFLSYTQSLGFDGLIAGTDCTSHIAYNLRNPPSPVTEGLVPAQLVLLLSFSESIPRIRCLLTTVLHEMDGQ